MPVANFFTAVIESLYRNRSILTLTLTSLAIGLVYSLSLIGSIFIDPYSDYWRYLGHDQAQAFIGLHYYLQEPLGWPLFLAKNLGPQGANIVFTDSIPIMALIGKLVCRFLVIPTPVFVIVWFVLCYCLSALFAALVLRELCGKGMIYIVIGAFAPLTVPIFLFRIGHYSLLGQFLIIWSFYGYLLFTRRRNYWIGVFYIYSSIIVGLLIHAYLFAMAFALFLVAVLQRKTKLQEKNIVVLRVAAGGIGLTTVSMLVFGYIGAGSILSAGGGYGMFSMNVLSPILPQISSIFPEFARMMGVSHPACDVLDVNGKQLDAYNYLGAGFLVLLVLHVVLSRSQIKDAIRTHGWLSVLLASFTLFAISTTVYFGPYVLVDMGLTGVRAIDYVINQFRFSGRFFWPVTYVLLFGLISLTIVRFSRSVALTILLTCSVLQFIDTHQLRQGLVWHMSEQRHPFFTDDAELRALMVWHEKIVVLPTIFCAIRTDRQTFDTYIALQMAAAERATPINSYHAARSLFDCSAERALTSTFPHNEPETLYIYPTVPGWVDISQKLVEAPNCWEMSFGYVCSASISGPQNSRSPYIKYSAE